MKLFLFKLNLFASIVVTNRWIDKKNLHSIWCIAKLIAGVSYTQNKHHNTVIEIHWTGFQGKKSIISFYQYTNNNTNAMKLSVWMQKPEWRQFEWPIYWKMGWKWSIKINFCLYLGWHCCSFDKLTQTTMIVAERKSNLIQIGLQLYYFISFFFSCNGTAANIFINVVVLQSSWFDSKLRWNAVSALIEYTWFDYRAYWPFSFRIVLLNLSYLI